MPFTETFERKVLFKFARVGVVCIVLLLTIVLIVAVGEFIGYYGLGRSNVSPEEVFSRLAPFTESTSPSFGLGEGGGMGLPSRLPIFVQRYFAEPSTRARLLSELSDLSEDEQQDYLDNLTQVVQEAENHKISIENSIDVFMRLRSQRRIQSLRVASKRAYCGIVALSALALLGLFTLILVLLAIERNTRHGER
jgi:hypothetical protein